MNIYLDNVLVGSAKFCNTIYEYYDQRVQISSIAVDAQFNASSLKNELRDARNLRCEDTQTLLLAEVAYLTSYSFDQNVLNNHLVMDLEFMAKDVFYTRKVDIKCSFCTKMPRYVTHSKIIEQLQKLSEKNDIFYFLKDKNPWTGAGIHGVPEALEIMKGHLPESYAKIEKLLVLL